MSILSSKNIILGVTGGVAAYKALELCRILIKAKANVQVVMSKSALEFIKPLAFQSITGNKVRSHLFDLDAEQAMGHIELARWADYIVIAPATANIISKLSYGLSDDLLLTLCLATKAKIFVAPAMNKIMFEKDVIQENISKLKNYNFEVIGPAFGEQACGDIGYGRMVEPLDIVNYIEDYILKKSVNFDLNSKKILITAGPTKEFLDPVRFISNQSSGKMGYYLARAANSLGAEVILVSGPVDSEIKQLINLDKIKLIEVESADDMYAAVHNNLNNLDVFISTAAVVDYKSKEIAQNKIKKENQKQDNLNLNLALNKDIALSVGEVKGKNLITVGFAAETDETNEINYAENKLKNKKLDMIFLNNVSDKTIGFNSELNEVQAIYFDKVNIKKEKISKSTKQELAYKILLQIYSTFMV